MDMAVASLFKHKVRFTFEGVYTEIYELGVLEEHTITSLQP